uniref:Uncharacterized protein n=1 Tax=Leersia perrieri TaxID=77586 RepID=A0A0D9XHZ9_9ORYZ
MARERKRWMTGRMDGPADGQMMENWLRGSILALLGGGHGGVVPVTHKWFHLSYEKRGGHWAVITTAGSDTSSSTMEWAMAELLKNRVQLAKACDELVHVVGSKGRIEESEIVRLPYLQAVVKETLRLHPPAPLILRRAKMEMQIRGYTIPKGAKILINVWAMGRDKHIWPEPDKFMPERFLDRTIDFRGGDLELIPFGAGRRICPGMPLAIRMVHVVLASLLMHFKWRLPDEVEQNGIDMTERFGLTLVKAIPLSALVTPT